MSALARAARFTSRGFQHHKRGDLTGAVRLYQKALEIAPALPDALHHAACAARQLSQHARAKGKPDVLDASTRLMHLAVESATAIAQQAAAANLEAFEAIEGQAGTVRKLYAAMVHNYAWFQKDNGVLTGANGALALYASAVQLDPNLSESWTNLGHCWGDLGNRMRAEACWHRALECPTPTPEATYNLAFVKLMKGDYLEGWRNYEARWESPVFLASYGRPDLPAPRWNGASLDGTLYLHGEQGAGDMLMMARYIPLIATGVRHIIVEVPTPLVRLFARTFPWCEIVALGQTPPAHHTQLPMMSLPAALGTLLETIPAPVRFASNPVETGAPPINSPRIGLCWKGSATHPNDRNRSMPFEACAQLLKLPGVSWQSLQWGSPMDVPLEPLGDGDFLDTASAIARCELVITVDTSVAHLAASMGIETWILLPHHAEWRWLQDREDSPWYPSARLMRQASPNDWSELIGRVHSDLMRRYT
jgi:Tfp pilus assembly protein PilF